MIINVATVDTGRYRCIKKVRVFNFEYRRQSGGAVAEWVRASTGDRTIDGSTPTAGDFEFGTLANPLTLLCQCLSDETL